MFRVDIPNILQVKTAVLILLYSRFNEQYRILIGQ